MVRRGPVRCAKKVGPGCNNLNTGSGHKTTVDDVWFIILY